MARCFTSRPLVKNDCWAKRRRKAFVEELRQRGVEPLSVGESIVATWHPHEAVVLDVIRSLGLELQVIFNKDAVMILPAGVNKGTGVRAALDELGLSTHNALGIGDAENDHAFLGICECSVAVGNALPVLKERADVVTTATHGAGVEEIIEQLLADDLRSLQPRLRRHEILLGRTEKRRGILRGAVWDAGGGGGAVGRRQVHGGDGDCGAADTKAISDLRD